MLWLTLACSSSLPLPPGLPENVVPLRVRDGVVTLGATRVEGWEVVAAEPTEPVDAGLLAAFGPVADRPLWVELPADTPFWGLRRVLGSAKEAGVGEVFLSTVDGTEVFPVSLPPRFTIGGACEAPIPVTGVAPLVTVSLQRGLDGAWVIATARFVPVTADGPTEGLAPACLDVPACDVLFTDPKLVEVCAGGLPGALERVSLGGDTGCLLPIAKSPEQAAGWRPELAARIAALGLADHPLRVVMPEARTRLDALFAVLGGFVDAGLPVPHVGATLLVEGNDGPPVCDAPVRDRAALAEAGARWLGSMRWKQEEVEDGGG